MNEKLRCGKCSYEWEYKGNLERATCPNCYNKVRTNKKEKELNERK